MSEAWAAIVAAVAAGLFGIGGILTGIIVGRRQTTDQATVEHGQWLRGQRQTAYTEALAAWDVFEVEAEAFWERYEFGSPDGSNAREVQRHKISLLQGPGGKVQQALQVSTLLGPAYAAAAADKLRLAMNTVVLALPSPVEPPTGMVDPERGRAWIAALVEARQKRDELHGTAMRVLRTPPTVETEDGLL